MEETSWARRGCRPVSHGHALWNMPHRSGDLPPLHRGCFAAREQSAVADSGGEALAGFPG